jgi:hypothetical protein
MTDVERGRIDSERVARWWAGFMLVFHRLGAVLKVLLVTVGSLLAVLFASLVISIIQFQERLTVARSQNVNVTLESLQLLQEHQDYVASQFNAVRTNAAKVANLGPDYQARLNWTSEMVSSICTMLNPEKHLECSGRLLALINNKSAQIEEALGPFKPVSLDAQKTAEIKASTAMLQKALVEGAFFELSTMYLEANRTVETGCRTLMQYVSDRLGATTILMMSPEMRMTIRVECTNTGGLDTTQTTLAAEPSQTVAPPNGAAAPPAQPDAAADQGRVDVRGVSRNLLSELVFYYRFYVSLTSAMGQYFPARGIILAPPEFIVILLVISAGILGSFLFHSYTMFRAPHYTVYPSWAAIFLRGTLSVMCALVIFFLSRTGFVVLTDGAPRAGEAAISPFVIAFVSVAAGLLAEHALVRIRSVGERALKDRSTEVTKVETRSVEIKKVETTDAETNEKPATG